MLFIGGNGEITVSNLLAQNEKVEIIGANTNYIHIVICDRDCDDTQVIPNLLPGFYNVQLNMYGTDNSYCYRQEQMIEVFPSVCTDEDEDGICAEDDCDDNNPNLPATPGTACDDGDANTIDDVYLADGCTCAGSLDGSAKL